jgi:protein TonB
MLGLTSHPSRLRLTLWLGGASLLVGAACLVPGPDRDSATGPELSAEAPLATDPAQGPVFTPYAVGPEILNRTEVQHALEEGYPPLLREAGIGGTAAVWFFIDTEGRVQDTRIRTSSGHAPLDAAALRVAGTVRFAPARQGERAVPVWVTFPITFQTKPDASP